MWAKENTNSMKNIVGWAAFFAALGLVGNIERGGSLTLAWWLLPLLAVWYVCLIRKANTDD